MNRTQKNKATAKHLGLLKAKLAKLKRELITPAKGAGGAAVGEGFDVTKTGDSRIGLVGTMGPDPKAAALSLLPPPHHHHHHNHSPLSWCTVRVRVHRFPFSGQVDPAH